MILCHMFWVITFLVTKKLVSCLRIMLDSGEEDFISFDEITEIENILESCCKLEVNYVSQIQ